MALPAQPRGLTTFPGQMVTVRAACFPPSDRRFARFVEQVMGATDSDLSSPEGIALVQATLRKSYPVAVLHPGKSTIEAHRDGSGPADESIASWLSAVYERHGGLVYGLAVRILGGATHAEDVVERAFLEVARTGGTALTLADAGRDVCAEACRLSIATLRA